MHVRCLGHWQQQLRVQKGIGASRRCDVCRAPWSKAFMPPATPRDWREALRGFMGRVPWGAVLEVRPASRLCTGGAALWSWLGSAGQQAWLGGLAPEESQPSPARPRCAAAVVATSLLCRRPQCWRFGILLAGAMHGMQAGVAGFRSGMRWAAGSSRANIEGLARWAPEVALAAGTLPPLKVRCCLQGCLRASAPAGCGCCVGACLPACLPALAHPCAARIKLRTS